MSKNNGSPSLDYSTAAIASKRKVSTGPVMFIKLDRKRPPSRKIETATPLSLVVSEDIKFRNESLCNKDGEEINRVTKLKTRRELFSRNSEENTHNFDGPQAGSSFHFCDEVSFSVAKVNNAVKNHHGNHKESDDLFLIRKQLLQIENQQSSLFGLLQEFSRIWLLVERNDDYRTLRRTDPKEYFAGVRREWVYRREESDRFRNDLIALAAPVPIRDSFSMYPETGESPTWEAYKRKFIRAVTQIRVENNRMLLRRNRYFMYKLATDSVRASGRELLDDEKRLLLQNPNYISDDYMSDEEP